MTATAVLRAGFRRLKHRVRVQLPPREYNKVLGGVGGTGRGLSPTTALPPSLPGARKESAELDANAPARRGGARASGGGRSGGTCCGAPAFALAEVVDDADELEPGVVFEQQFHRAEDALRITII